MRPALAILLGAVVAAADPPDPDAAAADPARWVEPRGSASGSFRSRALPVATEIEEAWQLAFDAIEAPPVHWDGTGYVVVRAGGKPHLVAFDLATGKESARTSLRGFLAGSPLLVWDHLVLLQPDEEQISGFRLGTKRFHQVWTFRGGTGVRPRMPVVHDNEVYLFLGDSLARVRPGSSTPSWTTPVWRASGRPTVYGAHVFLAGFDAPVAGELGGRSTTFAELHVTAYRRTDGREVASRNVGVTESADVRAARLDVMVAGSSVYIGSDSPFVTTRGKDSHCIVPAVIAQDSVSFGESVFWDCRTQPAHHPRVGTLLLSPARPPARGLQWCADREGKFYTLASEADQPDLFRERVPPTVLGDVVYFGSWAADLATSEVLWRLPVTQVTSPAVPADGLVLVVDQGKTLRAFRGRGKQ